MPPWWGDDFRIVLPVGGDDREQRPRGRREEADVQVGVQEECRQVSTVEDVLKVPGRGALLLDRRLEPAVEGREFLVASNGGWFIRAMLPYRSDEGGIEGVVITFTDVSETKAAEREFEASGTYLDSISATIRQPLVVLDENCASFLRPAHSIASFRSSRGS